MNVQRLKFAWARGARIQVKDQIDPAWSTVKAWDPTWKWVDVRIHPDDAHLEYGPLSTALRSAALLKDGINVMNAQERQAHTLFAYVAISSGAPVNTWDQDDWDLAALLVAELWADEGM